MLQDKLLQQLEQNRGRMLSGGELARRLGVSRTAVWKAVHNLQEAGHTIESLQGSGYRLCGSSDGISEPGIREYLRTTLLGQTIEVHRSLDSTSSYLKERAAGLPEGHVVIADEQSGGRGRMGRSFLSPGGEGLYMSLLLRPPLPSSEASFLTICAAVAVCDALQEVGGFEAGIKWVNDIFYQEKKLCGILTEAFVSAELQTVDYAVLGIGINTGEVAPEVAEIATSLQQITGRRGLRGRLAAAVLFHLEEAYQTLLREGAAEILARYRARMFILGREVQVVQQRESYTAIVQGIDSGGALLVEADGETRRLFGGEVHLKLH